MAMRSEREASITFAGLSFATKIQPPNVSGMPFTATNLSPGPLGAFELLRPLIANAASPGLTMVTKLAMCNPFDGRQCTP